MSRRFYLLVFICVLKTIRLLIVDILVTQQYTYLLVLISPISMRKDQRGEVLRHL